MTAHNASLTVQRKSKLFYIAAQQHLLKSILKR